jgi:hypothetical protein
VAPRACNKYHFHAKPLTRHHVTDDPNLHRDNEAHIDPSSMVQGRILREQGTRYDTENIQERPEKQGVRLHIAAWINWYEKAEKLEFYNDENDSIIKPRRPQKPRKTMYETKDEFSQRILQ